jgi:hypothetical protein
MALDRGWKGLAEQATANETHDDSQVLIGLT